MTNAPARSAPLRPLWLILLCASRFGSSLAFMVHAGALTPTMRAWGIILGIGAGGVAPPAVGLVLDGAGAGPGAGWGWGFALLGVGGGLAAVCAALLPADRPASRVRS